MKDTDAQNSSRVSQVRRPARLLPGMGSSPVRAPVQGFPNQLAAQPRSAIINLRRRVADEICDWRLLPWQLVLCFAGVDTSSIGRKVKSGRFKKWKIANKIGSTEGWLSG